MNSFFSELKRRNVYKVAVAYAVVGWLVIQVAATTFPILEIPNLAIKLVIAMVALGFPIALVIAWAFEMTPEGMKRTAELSPDEMLPQWSRRKFAALIGFLALCAAALLVLKMVGTARWAVRSVDQEDGSGSSRTASLPIPEKSDALVGPIVLVNLAQIECRAGHAAEAIEILRRLLTMPCGAQLSIPTLRIHPVWDPIRNDPGFQQLLAGSEKIGP